MFARVTSFEGDAERLEEGIRLFREDALPWLRDATGFRGWIVLVDRERGQSLSVTFWEDEETMKDNEASGGTIRDEFAAAVETTMKTLEFYEVAAVEALGFEKQ